jgi:hypothetical protein
VTQIAPPTNAVHQYLAALSRPGLGRLCRGSSGATVPDLTAERRALLASWFELDLCRLLNRLRRAELDELARGRKLATSGSIGELRARLWRAGAVAEAGSDQHLGTPLQPVPLVLGGKLRIPARGNGIAPPAHAWPRPIPCAAAVPAPDREPDSVDELLDNAARLVGVRLGPGGRNKGAHGAAIARALGVVERGHAEADWRGEVELKSVPVVRDPAGWWRVKEDPAVSMETGQPLAKLRKVLWIARVADRSDSPVLSWYFQEADGPVDRLLARDLHTRPKGGAGATSRGWYLHKRFFLDSGFVRSLNG